MRLDPQNMGLGTLNVEISTPWAEIWRNIHFLKELIKYVYILPEQHYMHYVI